MDEDPIKEEKTIFEKFKELGKKIFKKPPKQEDYFTSIYKTDEEKIITEKWNVFNEAIISGGVTFNEARGILKFDKIIK